MTSVAVLATVYAAPAFAAAGDECVKILGYEWSGEKQSMDPADMHSGDDAYHTFAVYNRLVDVDDDFNVAYGYALGKAAGGCFGHGLNIVHRVECGRLGGADKVAGR